LTNYEALHNSEANKYKIYKAIIEALPKCLSIEELEKRLHVQGIQTQYKYKGQTMEKQGVSFKIGADCFRGSQVDRKFSLANLQKSVAINQYQPQTLKPEVEETRQASSVNISNLQGGLSQEDSENKSSQAVESVLDILMKPEESMSQVPHELKKNKRKKKKS